MGMIFLHQFFEISPVALPLVDTIAGVSVIIRIGSVESHPQKNISHIIIKFSGTSPFKPAQRSAKTSPERMIFVRFLEFGIQLLKLVSQSLQCRSFIWHGHSPHSIHIPRRQPAITPDRPPPLAGLRRPPPAPRPPAPPPNTAPARTPLPPPSPSPSRSAPRTRSRSGSPLPHRSRTPAATSGSTPRMNDSAVIITARKRSRAALTATSAAGVPASRRTFANSTIRIAFLLASPISITALKPAGSHP